MTRLRRINHFYILTFITVLIYALGNDMQSPRSASVTVFLAEMREPFSGFTRAVCVHGAAGDRDVNCFPLESNSIQNQRIIECLHLKGTSAVIWSKTFIFLIRKMKTRDSLIS